MSSDSSTSSTTYEAVNDVSDLKSKLESGTNVQLSSDLTLNLTEPIEIGKMSSSSEIILDLGNKTLTISKIDSSNSNRLIVAEGATVTIQNGTIVYRGENGSADSKSPIRVGSMNAAASTPSTSNLTLNDVNITSADYGVAVFGKANLTVTDSNIIATSSAIATNGSPASKGGNSCGSTITINEGQYTSTETAAIYFPSGDTLTVTDGTFTGKTGFDIRAGTVTISNAKITAEGKASDGKTEDDGPIAWGIGVAVFDNASYGDKISVSLADVTFECNTFDIYVGQHKVTGTEQTPTTFDIESNSTNSPNGNISLTVRDYFTYNTSSSDNQKLIGSFAVKLAGEGFEFADGTVIGSACTLTVEGKAVIRENVTVTNNGILTCNGTITGSGKLTGSAGVLIDLVKGTVSGITFDISNTRGTAIVVSSAATGNVTIKDCIIYADDNTNGQSQTTPDSGIYVNLMNSNVLISNITFNNFGSNILPINVDILNENGKVKISDCTFKDCNRRNNVVFDAWVNTTIGKDQNIDFDCDTRVDIWSSDSHNATFSIPKNITFTNKSILTIDDSTSLIVDGKLIYDEVYNKTEDGVKTLDSGLIIKFKGDGNLEVKNINFKTKGLYVEGANDVTIQKCTFTNISQSPISSDSSPDFANGISLVKCNGDITIQKNTISGGDVTTASTPSNPGHTRGILIMGCGDSDDTLVINDNIISKIPYNAIQISKYYGTTQAEIKFGTIELSGNTISEWDADNDSKESDLYGAGRAIRIDLGSVTTDIRVINNTFIKGNTLGTTTDDGNVLKVTVATGGIANVTLTGNKFGKADLEINNPRYVIIPASSSGATISGAEGELYGMNVADLSTDLSFVPIDNYNFKVNGTLNYVIGYEGFWSGNAAMQSGYYLPFKLTLPAGGDYTNLSMKLIGKDTKEINSFDNEITDNNTISFVFFITGEFDEIKLIIDYGGTSVDSKSSYTLDLSGLEFEGGITTAPIADNAPNAESTEILKMNISQPEDYNIEMSVGNDSTILKLNAENVIYHRNANKAWGYWVGVAIPVPKDITAGYTAYMGWTSYSLANNGGNSLGDNWDGLFTKNEMTYITFYFNAGSADMKDSKGYIAVDWDDATETNKPICYTIDLSDVTLGADLDVYTAPIKDNPGTTETAINDLASGYAISLNDINNNIVNLSLSAKDLKMHRNGNNDWGYWVGVAIEVPNSVTSGVKYGFGTNSSISANNEYGSLDVIDSKNYLTFYVNAGSYAPKTYIAVDFDGTGTTYEETIYCLDITGVNFSSNDTNAVKLTFNSGYTSGPSDVISYYHSGDEITLPGSDFFKRSSYSFAGWSDGTTTYAAGAEYTVSAEASLKAVWSYNGGSGGGGVPITPPPVVPDVPDEPTIVPDSNGNVDVVIDDKKADELVHEAVSSGSDSITILDTKNVSGNVSSVTVSTADLETISKKIENNNNIDSVSIETSKGDIIIEKEVLSSILENTNADSVSFEVEDAKNKLTEEQKKAVGDRPVYDINIKAGNENVTSFNGKTITISLPYTLKAGEDSKNIVVYYVKDDGSLEKVNCEYKNGKVIFDTDHLSKYVIGYEESDKPVTPDTPDDNKKDNNNTIYYAVAAVIIILIIIALAYYFMKKKQ